MDRMIDSLDARLIDELRENPRVGLLEISRRLGVARGTVQARLAKLEQRGVITGYGPEVEPGGDGLSDPRVDAARASARAADGGGRGTRRRARGPRGRRRSAGRTTSSARVVARDTEHLQEIVNRLVASPAIHRSTSHIVLTRQVPPRTAPLVRAAAANA